MDPPLYMLRWARLLFAREFPVHQVWELWDAVFAETPDDFELADHVAVAMLELAGPELRQQVRLGRGGEGWGGGGRGWGQLGGCAGWFPHTHPPTHPALTTKRTAEDALSVLVDYKQLRSARPLIDLARRRLAGQALYHVRALAPFSSARAEAEAEAEGEAEAAVGGGAGPRSAERTGGRAGAKTAAATSAAAAAAAAAVAAKGDAVRQTPAALAPLRDGGALGAWPMAAAPAGGPSSPPTTAAPPPRYQPAAAATAATTAVAPIGRPPRPSDHSPREGQGTMESQALPPPRAPEQHRAQARSQARSLSSQGAGGAAAAAAAAAGVAAGDGPAASPSAWLVLRRDTPSSSPPPAPAPAVPAAAAPPTSAARLVSDGFLHL